MTDLWPTVYVFVLASFIGLGIIRRVSRLLHTPLMSLTNAISAIAVVGAILVTGGDYPLSIRILGAVALFASISYIAASALFILALYWMNTPATARKGVYAGVAGTTIAVLITWAEPGVMHHWWIIGAIALGFVVGVPLSRVPLTAVPQRTALSHAFGGVAAGLVGTAEYYLR